MKKQRKQAKGFTLVELVVVIAIIAILGAVSVVGYFAFIEKANKSVDEQLCTQYNTILKAEQALDDDITMAELLEYIEENGIRSNHFETKSKDYVFGYDRNKQVVLLDSSSGEILFPKNHSENPELWQVLDPSLKLMKGIDNYTLLNSVFVEKTIDTTGHGKLTFDLNHNAFMVQKKSYLPQKDMIEVGNGIVVAQKGSELNVDNDLTYTENAETTKVDQTSLTGQGVGQFGGVFKSTDVKKFGNCDDSVPNSSLNLKALSEKATDLTYTIKGKYFGSESHHTIQFNNNGEAVNLGDGSGLYYGIEKANILSADAKLVFDGCIFSNVYFDIAHNMKFEFKNCKFYGTEAGRFAINYRKVHTIGNDLFYNIHHNLFSTGRGINLSYPESETLVSKINNNTFELLVNDTKKNNCIQFSGAGAGSDTFDSHERLEIKNNIANKGNAFLCFHEGNLDDLVTKAGDIVNENLFNNFKSYFANEVTFENNTLAEGMLKVQKDPDYTDSANLAELMSAVEACVR